MTTLLGEYKILNESGTFNTEQIQKIESYYKAKYICETCLKGREGGWANFPVAVFYTEKAHPEGSNYFGLFFNGRGELTITNAISALEPFAGIMIENDVVYSRYRHDYREHNGIFVDGGRDYLRCGGADYDKAKIVNLQIVKDNLELVQ
jgi:hypothetical protein